MKPILLCTLLTISTGLTAQSPVKSTFAYSRRTISGIPEGPATGASSSSPFRTTYFIYVVVRKGAVLSVNGVWLEGKYHAASLRKVVSPVLIDHDVAVPTGKKDVLVRKTSDDVYQVEPGEERAWTAADDTEKALTQRNDVVVFLKAGPETWYGPVPRITLLQPVAAM